ncbi:hypothetical protein G3R49_19675 [Shewanella sp. WXL01]|nr:hypothetical protein [Shewanella sp. WXL01]NKF52780.1 hypothetical protein [Shewanella sp. WXL01]
MFDKPHQLNGGNLTTVEITDDLPPSHHIEPLNLTAPESGIFVPEKDYRAKAELDAELMSASQHYFTSDLYKTLSPAGHAKREKARLVKECKSPTRTKRDLENDIKQSKLSAFDVYLQQRGKQYIHASEKTIAQPHALHCAEMGALPTFTINKKTGEITNIDTERRTAIARLSRREWSDEYRISVTTQNSPTQAPPAQAGDRVTKFLTTRAAKNILDSGAYVAATQGGFTTFLTLTFNEDARQRINDGVSTIGAECSRFFDALQKMYQRGWTAEQFEIPENELKKDMFHSSEFACIANDEQFIEPIGDKLDYLWVAEAPAKPEVIETKNGFDSVDARPNPHCHVLLRWQVEPHLFRAWAKRIESMWGHGFAKLERIKNAKAASGYMLKALGYLLKGEQKEASDQGTIKGNRYNISKSARALPWEHIASFHAEHMASLIGEVKAKLERKAAPIVHRIKENYKKIGREVRGKAFAQKQFKPVHRIDERIKAIEKAISKDKAELRESPVMAFDYHISFKGESPFKKFFEWAIGVRLWGAFDSQTTKPHTVIDSLMTVNPETMRKSFSKVRTRLIEREQDWSHRLKAMLPPEIDFEQLNNERLQDFCSYQQLEAA